MQWKNLIIATMYHPDACKCSVRNEFILSEHEMFLKIDQVSFWKIIFVMNGYRKKLEIPLTFIRWVHL